MPIVLPLGKAVGGTTLVNSGTCFRTPDRVLERWGAELGLEALAPDRMRPHFGHVERETGVAKVPPELAGRNAAVVKRGADALGWSGDYIYRNARGCVGSGVCAFGCPTGAKQHAGQVWIDAAERAGARTVTGARARKIETRKGRRAGVCTPSARTAARSRCEADTDGGGLRRHPHAAAAAAQPAGRGSGELGRNLAIHPGTAVRALFDEDIDMADGVPQSYYIDEFADEGIMFEGAAGPPDYLAVGLPVLGRAAARADAALRPAVPVRRDGLRPLARRGQGGGRASADPLPPARRGRGPDAPRGRAAHRALLGRGRAHGAAAGGRRGAAARRRPRPAGAGPAARRPATWR